jgi:hypothetical protein
VAQALAQPSAGSAGIAEAGPAVQLVAEPAQPAPAAPAAAMPPGAQSEKELDELAHKLYGHLRARLRLELLVDRERAGLLTDQR